MKKTNKTRYNLDIQSFRKRILFSSSLTFILYASILTWAYTRIEPESTQKFFFISACVIGIISFFLFKKYTNQLRILKNTYIEIEGKVLRQYTINNICTEIDLKGVSGLQRDSFRGYPRLLLLTPEGNFSLINPVQIEKLQVELEQIIGKKTAARIFKGKEILTKAIFFFSPSVIIGFVYLFQTKIFDTIKLHVYMVYITFIINLMFFLHSFSEDKVEGGISANLVRKLLIILGATLAYLLYSVFVSGLL